MSTSTTTPEQTTTSHRTRAFHQPFSWIDDAARDYPSADFISLTIDVCNGVHTCLEIIEASDPECRCPSDPDADEAELPVVSAHHTGILRRFCIAATRLLREHADQKINWINEYGPDHLQAMKTPDK